MSAPPDHATDGYRPTPRSVLAERLRLRKSKRSPIRWVSIQSKLMLMLLTMSVAHHWIAGGIGFESGRSSLARGGVRTPHRYPRGTGPVLGAGTARYHQGVGRSPAEKPSSAP